jgi:hypothetical protein
MNFSITSSLKVLSDALIRRDAQMIKKSLKMMIHTTTTAADYE